MSDDEFLEKIAALWIELGGDAEGVAWLWGELQKKVKEMENCDEI